MAVRGAADAMNVISTTASGPARPDCTVARAGGADGKYSRVDLVHRREVRGVGQVDARRHDVRERHARRLEQLAGVLHDGARLHAHVAGDERVVGAVPRHQAREEQRVAAADRVAVGVGRALPALRLHDLAARARRHGDQGDLDARVGDDQPRDDGGARRRIAGEERPIRGVHRLKVLGRGQVDHHRDDLRRATSPRPAAPRACARASGASRCRHRGRRPRRRRLRRACRRDR